MKQKDRYSEYSSDPNRKKYLEAYLENEYSANKQMSFACLAIAIVLLIVWIGYITRIFTVDDHTLILINIMVPINIVLLLSTLVLQRTKYLRRPWFKYFVLAIILIVMGFANVIFPKHAYIGWAIVIILTNHYYNPKLGLIIFISAIILMFGCLYAGLFIGEFDQNLLDGEIDSATGLISCRYDSTKTWPNTIEGRVDFLAFMRENGNDRYYKTFLFYYLPRVLTAGIVYFISNALNMRTYKLLIDEIKVNTEQQRVNNELSVAKEIQHNALPSDFIDNEDVEVLGELVAAKEVGGDFYYYSRIDNNHIMFVIGDISGKGIPAAMFMMKTLTCIKNFATAGKTPSQILTDTNSAIEENNDNKMFVTCFLGILNTDTGEFKFANAGHNPPLIGQKQKFSFLTCKSGFLLGVMDPPMVQDEVITLNKGDVVTLYTDGITEARNKEGEFFGEKRLLDFYNQTDFSCLLHVHLDLKDRILSFTNGAEQSDDMTYLAFVYKGNKIEYITKEFDADKEEIPGALEEIKAFAEKYNFPKAFTNTLLTVGDELISNIVKYAYKDENGTVYMRLLYDLDDKLFTMTIIDSGIIFNPFITDNKPLQGDVQERKEGGLGILIVKQVMDSVTYDNVNGKNIIVLKKKL
ncbi:MAG: SpoIIE family protein phosphatase [Bacilli bacterium]|nr:SpoIIE family protein phosphatase [Bacilli bacterium]